MLFLYVWTSCKYYSGKTDSYIVDVVIVYSIEMCVL